MLVSVPQSRHLQQFVKTVVPEAAAAAEVYRKTTSTTPSERISETSSGHVSKKERGIKMGRVRIMNAVRCTDASVVSINAAGGWRCGLTGFRRSCAVRPLQLTFPNSGGALRLLSSLLLRPFKAATGIDIICAPWMESGAHQAMVETMPSRDVIAPPCRSRRDGETRASGTSRLRHHPTSRTWARLCARIFVLTDVAALAMSWNTNSFNSETRPKNWAEFFDSAAKPGTRSL